MIYLVEPTEENTRIAGEKNHSLRLSARHTGIQIRVPFTQISGVRQTGIR